MKKIVYLSFAFTVLIFCKSWAQVPQKLNYQGFLTENNLPVTTQRTIALTIKDGTTNRYTESFNVTPDKGLFSVTLGDSGPVIPSNIWGKVLTVKISIAGDTIATVPFTTVPYAFMATNVADNAVTTIKLVDNAVTNAKLGSDIDAAKLTTGTLSIARITDGTVTSAKITDGTITNADISASAAIAGSKIDGTTITGISAGNLTTGTLPIARIADDAVTSAKITDGTIATGDLANSSVTTLKIVDGTIATVDIADGNVTNVKVASGIDASKLTDETITSSKITDGTIATGDLANGSVTTLKIVDGTIATLDIADGNVTNAKLASGIDASKLTDETITSAKITDGTIATTDLANSSVSTLKIVDGTIATADIADGNVTNVKLASGIDAAKLTTGTLPAAALPTTVPLGNGANGRVSFWTGAGTVSSNANLFWDNTNSRMGINTSSPAYPLDIYSPASASIASLRIRKNVAGSNTMVEFFNDAFSLAIPSGQITENGGAVSYSSFTGSHYAICSESIEAGMLVSLDNTINHIIDSEDSEPIYSVSLSQRANDPTILGTYFCEANQQDQQGNKIKLIAAVGNGVVWVVDTGTPIEVGDYLISSSFRGHAMKNDAMFDKAYIVARSGEHVDWLKETAMINGVKHKKISVFYENFILNNYTDKLKKEVQELREAVEFLRSEINHQKKASIVSINPR